MARKAYTTDTENDSGPCVVQEGGECVMPQRRKKLYADWGVNIPTVIAFVMMLGSLIGYVVNNEKRMTENKEGQEVLKLADKGITERLAFSNEMAIRDRSEMREDIKEMKVMMIELVKRPRK